MRYIEWIAMFIVAGLGICLAQGRKAAYNATNQAMLLTYWYIGKRIVEQEQNGVKRAKYGEKLIQLLSKELTKDFGKGFSERNLRNFRKFYILFPSKEIWQACLPNLNWTHVCSLLRVPDESARLWYMKEASEESWSSRTLDRNIGTQYYYRLLQSPKKDQVIAEMQQKTAEFQRNRFELLKNPVVAEFLGFRTEDSFVESNLESAILSHIRDFFSRLLLLYSK